MGLFVREEVKIGRFCSTREDGASQCLEEHSFFGKGGLFVFNKPSSIIMSEYYVLPYDIFCDTARPTMFRCT